MYTCAYTHVLFDLNLQVGIFLAVCKHVGQDAGESWLQKQSGGRSHYHGSINNIGKVKIDKGPQEGTPSHGLLTILILIILILIILFLLLLYCYVVILAII